MNLTTISLGAYKATVDNSIAHNLVRADTALYDTTGQHIKVNQSYRSTKTQAELYKNRKPGQRVAPPGKSFHEKGLAVDVTNWKEAEPFLRKEGFLNPLADDKGHFSIGEFSAAKYKQIAAGGSMALIVAAGIILFFLMQRR